MLLILVAICILLFEICIRFIGHLLNWFYNAVNGHRIKLYKLSEEYLLLKVDQSKVNMQKEFAKYSKIQRKMNKVELSMKEMKSSRNSFMLTWKLKSIILIYMLYAVSIIVLMFFKRYESVASTHGIWLPSYVKGVLSYPTNDKDVIGFPIWVVICRQFSRAVFS